jgi:hypothetical protein
MFVVASPAAMVLAQDSPEPAAADKIYRCERLHTPLFTNKASYGCEEYEPRGAVRVAPNGAMFLEPPQISSAASAEVPKAPRAEHSAVLDLEDARLCELYDEWLTLNERTSGGFFYQYTSQAARWYALSRIFSSIGAPVSRCRR